MKRSQLADRHCPIARAGEQLVDAWTFIILREVFLANRRFEGLREQTGMSPRSLSLRLARLVERGILRREPYSQAPPRDEYHATPKGQALWPVLVTLKQWGDAWAGPWGRAGTPLQIEHKGRGHALQARLVCEVCGEPVDARSGHAHPGPAMARERDRLARQHKAAR
jgi:DNA-binding HxlR family transcriptional regulator